MTQNEAPALTKSERSELVGLLRRRARVAKADVKERTQLLLARCEEAMAAQYKPQDEAWADIVAAANQAVRDADAEIAALCRERGIPEDWRPSLSTGWHPRGETAIAGRRTELRKVATTRIAAMERAALAAIERQAVEAETALVGAGMKSAEARALLESLPTVEALMPMLDVTGLEEAVYGTLPAPSP